MPPAWVDFSWEFVRKERNDMKQISAIVTDICRRVSPCGHHVSALPSSRPASLSLPLETILRSFCPNSIVCCAGTNRCHRFRSDKFATLSKQLAQEQIALSQPAKSDDSAFPDK
jgi:hypothetical protein